MDRENDRESVDNYHLSNNNTCCNNREKKLW